MFTDLNLTDMESCYKVFRREVLSQVELKEQRFGFEPEFVAQIARLRLRIYEMGISYAGRTYEEGKKIGAKDGLRALYCIVRYNMPHAPLPIQFLGYLFAGGFCAGLNILLFKAFLMFTSVWFAAPLAFLLAAALNYWLCIRILFRHRSKWSTWGELGVYGMLVVAAGGGDLLSTIALLGAGLTPWVAKATASGFVLVLNYLGRRFLVFPESRLGPWAPTGVR
jgi:putative flippase GtrA